MAYWGNSWGKLSNPQTRVLTANEHNNLIKIIKALKAPNES
jgi:hypothetical protein